MKIIVLADDALMEELGNGSQEVIRINSAEEFPLHPNADAYVDLLFDGSEKRISLLQKLSPRPVLVNSVEFTLGEIGYPFIRFCGWPTFLKSNLLEATAPGSFKEMAGSIFKRFGKEVEWVKDQPGFLTPRVISMIINEAFLALEEGVSTREEIDTAMKLGTNYPYGPFEWAEKIGLNRIYRLLHRLSGEHGRYQPSDLLKKTSQV